MLRKSSKGLTPKLITIPVVLMLLGVCPVRAVDITFTTSGTIEEGDIYDNVYVENDGTIVDMSGGQIEGLWLYDTSIFNLHNGQISGYFSSIYIRYLSTINVLGGVIDKSSDFVVRGNANFDDGSITDYRLKTYDDSVVNIRGGSLNFDYFDLRGNMDIRGGSLVVDDIGLDLSSTLVNIHSENYNYNVNDETLSGYLVDGSYFWIGGVNQLEYDSFNFVPEPTTLLLLGIGGLLLRKRS